MSLSLPRSVALLFGALLFLAAQGSAYAADPFSGLSPHSANLHSHTIESDDVTDSDSPSVAFSQAWRNGLDALAVTDHAEMLTPAAYWLAPTWDFLGLLGCPPHADPDAWDSIGAVAADSTVAGSFLALRGFEWSADGGQKDAGCLGALPVDVELGQHDNIGHINVLGTADYAGHHYILTERPANFAGTLADFFGWVNSQPDPDSTVVCEFNHPNSYSGLPFVELDDLGTGIVPIGLFTRPPKQWPNVADPRGPFALIELTGHKPTGVDSILRPFIGPEDTYNGTTNVKIWQQALKHGWHLAPAMNEDNHFGSYGDDPLLEGGYLIRTGVWTDAFQKPTDLLRALRARRAYATEDPTLQLKFWLESGDPASPTTAIMGQTASVSGGNIVARASLSGQTAAVTDVTLVQICRDQPLPGIGPAAGPNDPPHPGLYPMSYDINTGLYSSPPLPISDSNVVCYYVRVGLGTEANGQPGLAYSAPVWINYTGQTGNPAPTNLQATAGHALVDLSWTPGDGATSYNIKRGMASGQEVTIKSGWSSTYFTDSGLTNGTTYHYVVSGNNAQGETANSNEASAEPMPGVYTWAGGGTSWYDPENWTPYGVPGRQDSVTIDDGRVEVSAGVTVANLTLTGGILGGSGSVTVTGTCRWTGGDVRCALDIPPGAECDISGGTVHGITNGGSLNNAGTVRLTDGGIYFGYPGTGDAASGGSITNSGIFFADSPFQVLIGDWSYPGTVASTGVVTNTGTLLRDSDGDPNFIFSRVDNSGTISCTAGQLDIDIRNSGVLNAPAGGALGVNGRLDAGTSIEGTGVFLGTATINGKVIVNGVLTLGRYGAGAELTASTDASFAGPGTVNIDGEILLDSLDVPPTTTGPVFNWYSGDLRATLSVAPGGVLNILGDHNKTINNGGVLDNAGTVDWTGGEIDFGYASYANGVTSGGTFRNSGTFIADPAGRFIQSVLYPGSFSNSGTVLRDAGGNGPEIACEAENSGTISCGAGTLYLDQLTQTAGATILNGGQMGGNIVLQGGLLRGSGEFFGSVSNTGGTVAPGSPAAVGTIVLYRKYVQGAGGRLALRIGGESQFDRLGVSGSAALDGTVDAVLTGGYRPAAGTQFQVMQYGSHTGAFATLNGSFSAAYGDTELALTAGALPQLAAAAGNGKVTLSWSATAGATGYNVKRGTGAGGPYAVLATVAAGTTYADTAVTNGTTYYYVVSALTAQGEGSDSNEASATPVAPPVAPMGLTATPGNAVVTLSWQAVAGADSYKLKRSAKPGGPYALLAGGIGGTDYSDTAVTNGTAYYYEVSASNAGGESPDSGEASATPLAQPDAPSGLAATAGDARVTLSWTAAARATGYEVRRGTAHGGPYTVVATGVAATGYTDASVTNGTAYYYVVAAVGVGGESGDSNEAAATPVAPPGAPTGLAAAPGNGRVLLTWSASPSAVSFTVRRSAASAGPFSAIAIGLSDPRYLDTAVANGQTYYYVVAAVDAGGTGADSAAVSATPLAPPPPPANLAASPGDRSVALSWTGAPTAAGYTVKRGTSRGGPYAPLATTTTERYTDPGLANGTAYFYVVSASNVGGESPDSAEAGATPDPLPGAPSGLLAKAVSRTEIDLSWKAPSGPLSGYRVERSADGKTFTEVASTAPDVTRLADTGLAAATSYTFRVRASSPAGASPYSDTAAAATAADTISGSVSLSSGSRSFRLAGTTVALLDTAGQPLATATTDGSGKYSFTALADGSYTVQATLPDSPTARSVAVKLDNGDNGDATADLTGGPLTTIAGGVSMVSVPYDYTGSGVDAAAALGIPTWAGGGAAIATYDPARSAYVLYPDLPGGSGRQTVPGRGYWVDEDGPQPFLMPGRPVASPFSEALQPGWNMIGDPFTTEVGSSSIQLASPVAAGSVTAGTPVSLSAAQAAGIVGGPLWTWDGARGQYAPADRLRPYAGYWIYIDPRAVQNQSVTLTVSRQVQ